MRVKLIVFVLFLPLLWGRADGKLHKLTFIGNSLTQAGPMPGFGWTGYWGVAASQADRDYLHRVQLGVTAHQGVIAEIQIIPSDFHALDTDIYTKVLNFAPDLIVVEMGDNAPIPTDQAVFDTAYATIRRAAPRARIIATGLWHGYVNDEREGQIKRAAQHYGMAFVALNDLDIPKNQVRSEGRCTNDAICWHPGDRGMQAIADRLLDAIYAFPGTIPTK